MLRKGLQKGQFLPVRKAFAASTGKFWEGKLKALQVLPNNDVVVKDVSPGITCISGLSLGIPHRGTAINPRKPSLKNILKTRRVVQNWRHSQRRSTTNRKGPVGTPSFCRGGRGKKKGKVKGLTGRHSQPRGEEFPSFTVGRPWEDDENRL